MQKLQLQVEGVDTSDGRRVRDVKHIGGIKRGAANEVQAVLKQNLLSPTHIYITRWPKSGSCSASQLGCGKGRAFT
jgi:hypothetical protein